MPTADHLPGLLKEKEGEVAVHAVAHHAQHHFPQNPADIRAMNLGEIAEEMIVAPAAAAAAPGIGLFQQRRLHAGLSGGDGGGEAGNAPAHDDKLGINDLLDGDHLTHLPFC